MASVGKASLTIVPKFDNLGKTVTNALNGINAEPSGVKMGKGVANGIAKGTSGLAKSGAIMGVFSAATTKALSMIASSVDSAVSRLDTLNNYPRVMQALGYSAQDSEASIAKMADHLTGLPTALNDMASTVQGISAMTGDLNLATDAGLALNDMLLASGSNTQLTTAAMEQFRQMLGKGKPEMQDWKSLTSTMPGQMKQLAEAMLGPTANANDLYEALGGGKSEAIITFDQLMQKMIEMDSTGSESFTSFSEQAKNATGGVQSSLSNMQTAISRGMVDVMKSVGSENIAGAIKGIGGAFESALGVVGDGIESVKPIAGDLVEAVSGIGNAAKGAFGVVAGAASSALPIVKGLSGALANSAPKILATGGAFAVFKIAGTHLAGFASKAKEARKASSMLEGTNKLLGTSFSPLSLGITGVSAVLGIALIGYLDAKKRSDDFTKSTTGLSDAIKKASSLDDYARKIWGVGEKAGLTAMRVDELRDSMAKHVDKINETNEQAETQIAQLNTAQSVIDTYAGKTDLSTDAQGRLEWAIKQVNEQFGLSVTAADVAADAYTDSEGNVISLKDRIYELIEAKKQEIKATALASDLTEATAMQKEASDTYAVARGEYEKYLEYYRGYYRDVRGLRGEEAEAAAAAQADVISGLSESRRSYEDTTVAVKDLYDEMGDTAQATSENADEFDRWANALEPIFESTLKTGGTTLAGLKDDLRSLGADTEKLNALSEDELLSVADAYNGTASSVIGVLDELGVEMTGAGRATAEMAASIADSLNGMDGVGDALEGVEVNVSDFADKLADAGVSTEQLNTIGSENLAQLATACGGNMDAMVFYIQHYNDTPIIDKNGNVQVDQASLIDAQGNLYTWDGSDLYDKNGSAVLDDVSLTDAQGNLWTWNGSALNPKGTTATVDDGSVEGAIGTRENWNNGSLWDKAATATINIFRNISDFFTGGSKNAAGGIRLNAEGGYRFHGLGAIATKAVPLDIVGEDGAEAIVPLTNKRYSLPFAKTLAEQIGSVGVGGGISKADIYDAVSAALESADIKAVSYIDGREATNILAPRMNARLGQIERRRAVGL